MATPKEIVQEIFLEADIRINGRRPWDIKVHNEQFFSRVLAGGSLAMGESYMDGWWDCKELDVLFDKLLRGGLDKRAAFTPKRLFAYLQAKLFNKQNRGDAKKNIEHHYDIGNDLYKAMLDETMTYSCGYWKGARSLKAAQEAKYELICQKIGLKKGMSVLDIGCGWGGFAIYAAKNYGARVLGVTLSEEQAALAKERAKGLQVEIRLQDYRDVKHKFDRIVSIGMFEHVGVKNYRTFFKVAQKLLKQDGLLLLHTIGGLKSGAVTDPWISKYIFPHSILPSAKQITRASEGLFVMEDWHNFGAHYDTTLMAWNKNVQKAWAKLTGTYDSRFKRMWEYYLLACAGSFRARKNQLWQIVYSPRGVDGVYERPV